MDDPELPVRVQAILGLTEMVTVHDSGPWHNPYYMSALIDIAIQFERQLHLKSRKSSKVESFPIQPFEMVLIISVIRSLEALR